MESHCDCKFTNSEHFAVAMRYGQSTWEKIQAEAYEDTVDKEKDGHVDDTGTHCSSPLSEKALRGEEIQKELKDSQGNLQKVSELPEEKGNTKLNHSLKQAVTAETEKELGDDLSKLAETLGREEIQNALNDNPGNLQKVIEIADEEMKSKLKKPLKLAFTGDSGVGKSTLINTYRGLLPGQPGAAAVGINETTTEMAAYPHPKYEKLVLYDLPGAGTLSNPQEGYYENMKLDEYDVVIIVSCNRFTEIDEHLARTLFKNERKFIFVRSKFDEDVRNYRKINPGKKISVEEVKEIIFENIKINYIKINLPEEGKVFFINCDDVMAFDFPQFHEYLYVSVPKDKQAALVHAMETTGSPELLKKKKKLLESGVFVAAMKAAACSAIPIPGLDVFVSKEVIENILHKYLVEFGLDPETIQSLSEKYDIDKEELTRITDKYTEAIRQPSSKNIVSYFVSLLPSGANLLIGGARAAIPAAAASTAVAAAIVVTPLLAFTGVIMAVAVVFKYRRVSPAVKKAIDDLYKCAVEVNDYIRSVLEI